MVNSGPAALAIIAVVVLCLGYVLPVAAKRRQVTAAVPAQDRFSAQARVIEDSATWDHSEDTPSSQALLGQTASTRMTRMNRPTVRQHPRPAPQAQARQVNQPAMIDRAHAARTRAVLAGSLLLLTIIAITLWLTVGLNPVAPTVAGALTVGVVTAGWRAARIDAGRAAPSAKPKAGSARKAAGLPKAAKAARTAQPVATPRTAGASGAVKSKAAAQDRAKELTSTNVAAGAASATVEAGIVERRPGVSGRIHSGQTEILPVTPLPIMDVELGAVSLGHATAEEAVEPAPEDPKTWTPVPVPPPAYTLSDEAGRWEPRALTDADFAQARMAAIRATEQAEAQAKAAGVDYPTTGSLPSRVIFASSGLDLDQALAKRRAANS